MTAPTLVLWAADDVALGVGLLRGIEKEVPRVEVHVLENCSHWIQQDKCVSLSRPTPTPTGNQSRHRAEHKWLQWCPGWCV